MRIIIRRFVCFALVAAVITFGHGLPAVADGSDADALLKRGEAVYENGCKACHEGGVQRAPHYSMLQLMAPLSIERALTEGVMREQAAGLSKDDIHAVSAFLSGITDREATPPLLQCKAGDDWFDRAAFPDVNGGGMDFGNSRFTPSEVGGITASDIPQLQLKWAFAFPGALRARSQPVTAGGALFVGSQDGSVYALDQETSCVHWVFHASAEVRTSFLIRSWATEDGTPHQDSQQGLLYFGDVVGNIYAVGLESGQLIWKQKPSDHPNATITATPALYRDRLYIAVSSLEVTTASDPTYECCKFRGLLVSYDALTGELVWTASTIEEPLRITGENSLGTPQFGPSGAPIWGGMAIDPARKRIYVGTGENYSSPASNTSDSIIAFNMDDGTRAWVFQATKNDAWNMGCESKDRANCPAEDGPDFDFGAGAMYVKLEDGQDFILAGQKSGDVYALDPDSGGLIWSRRLGRGGIQGGIHFGMTASGNTLFVPVSDFDDGKAYDMDPQPGMYALDIRTGALLWETPHENVCGDRQFCEPGISAAASSIPGAVLAGAMDGVLRAYDMKTGAIIWSFDSDRSFPAIGGLTGHGGSFGGISGPVFKDGRMFINSGYGLYFHMPGNVLLAFDLAKED